MQVEYVNPFLAASFSVLEMVLGETPNKGKLGVQQSSATTNEVNVVVGVTGAVQGNVVYGMSLTTALKIAGHMTMMEAKILDPLAKSAIAELCNMISGNAMLQLSEAGYTCDITPPSLVKGNNVEISLIALPALVVPVETQFGELTILVGLDAKK